MPGQAVPPVVVAIVEYVTTIGLAVVLVSVCAGIVVVPFVITPVMPAGCKAVQEVVAPAVAELSVTTVEELPEQIVWLDGVTSVLVRDDSGQEQLAEVVKYLGRIQLNPFQQGRRIVLAAHSSVFIGIGVEGLPMASAGASVRPSICAG